MPTTTNYGWTTPADTDLVKDGASAIRTLGSAIDTTVFNNAGAAIAKTIVDAKGDIIAATAADTVARLAVGANDTVLTADSSTATGLKWAAVSAGGMTQLATGSLSGSSVSLTSISGSYKELWLYVYEVSLAADNYGWGIQYNSITTSTYTLTATRSDSSSVPNDADGTRWDVQTVGVGGMLASSTNNFSIIRLPNYAASTGYKAIQFTSYYQAYSGSTNRVLNGGGYQAGTGAITSLQIVTAGTTFDAGTYILYGVS